MGGITIAFLLVQRELGKAARPLRHLRIAPPGARTVLHGHHEPDAQKMGCASTVFRGEAHYAFRSYPDATFLYTGLKFKISNQDFRIQNS